MGEIIGEYSQDDLVFRYPDGTNAGGTLCVVRDAKMMRRGRHDESPQIVEYNELVGCNQKNPDRCPALEKGTDKSICTVNVLKRNGTVFSPIQVEDGRFACGKRRKRLKQPLFRPQIIPVFHLPR